jgi:LacI family transcriptional regulator
LFCARHHGTKGGGVRDIALCMELTDFYEHGIARGVVRYAKSRPDWRLFGYGWMFRPLTDLKSWKGDGVIARVETSRDADRIASLGIPVVDVAGAYRRPGFRHVTNDDVRTGADAAAHLMACGFQRFAFLGVSGTIWSEDRRRGFIQGLGAGQLPQFNRSLDWWENPHESTVAFEEFLSGLGLPAALFACNDTTGLRATERAHRLGINVPEGLAILGVDNEDILCELASPSLSSIMLDCEAIGFRAAAGIDAILDGSGPAEGSRVSVPPREVAERESTRTFSCPDPIVARAVTFIRARAHEGIDVRDVVRVAAASRRSLEIRFRAATGRTIHDEIARARLSRARRLLKATTLTVEQVAAASGFGAVQRFHSAFRSSTGMSPGEWRSAAPTAPS